MQYEFKLNEVTGRIRQFESDERGHSHRKEYLTLEKKVQNMDVVDCLRLFASLSM